MDPILCNKGMEAIIPSTNYIHIVCKLLIKIKVPLSPFMDIRLALEPRPGPPTVNCWWLSILISMVGLKESIHAVYDVRET